MTPLSVQARKLLEQARSPGLYKGLGLSTAYAPARVDPGEVERLVGRGLMVWTPAGGGRRYSGQFKAALTGLGKSILEDGDQ